MILIWHGIKRNASDRSTFGNYFISMRLMGTAKLKKLTELGDKNLSSAVSSLMAELNAAAWGSTDDLLRQFTSAICNGNSVAISISEMHSVEFLVKYDTGMIFITSARTLAIRRETGPTAGRQAA
jgi:hypothetical protein